MSLQACALCSRMTLLGSSCTQALSYTWPVFWKLTSMPAGKSFREKLWSNEVQTKLFPLQDRLKIKYCSKFKHLENIYRNLSFPFTYGLLLVSYFLTKALEKLAFTYDVLGLQVYNYTVQAKILLYRRTKIFSLL